MITILKYKRSLNTEIVVENNQSNAKEIVPIPDQTITNTKPIILKIMVPKPQEHIAIFDESKLLKTYMLYNGESKNVEDLVIGDELMGTDSKPCKITDIQKVKERSYLVTPVKGEEFIVGESEILALTFCENNKVTWYDKDNCYKVRYFDESSKKQTSKDFSIVSWGDKEKAYIAANKYLEEIGDNNYFDIFVTEYMKSIRSIDYKIYKVALEFPHTEFEIDPYIIGMWLGDGTTASPHITSADPEIVDYFREYFLDFGLLLKTDGIRHRVTSGVKTGYPGRNMFLNYLKKINILNNKHIPMELLLTSRQNRLRLLAGLLDSDGSLQQNCYDFIQKRERLFDNVIFLARSLGFSCYKAPCVKVCTNAPNGPKAGDYFRCCISGEGLEEIPSLLNRKQAHERKQIKRAYVNGITLKYIGEKDIYRLSTDTTRFLMSDFTVRHRFESMINNDDKKIINVKKQKLNNLPFGYKRENDGIVINITESKTIIRIFKERKNNISTAKIAEALNAENIKTKKDCAFTDCIVGVILSHGEKYLGTETADNGELWPKILEYEYKDMINTIKEKRKISAPFGYKRQLGKIVIDEKSAKTIRFIFNEYKNKIAYENIVTKLNSANMKPARADNWNKDSVKRIIYSKEIYIGTEHHPAILENTF